jgi:asparagine synthase (glutamine-hydrolysing)
MCGIAGFVATVGHPREWQADLKDAVRALHHRGPDGEGVWLGDHVGLGHRRLSILDLSDRGRQPMVSASGRYVMVYNGEVYNFRDIRRQLESTGQPFASSGDSELVLASIEKWGVDAAVRRFIGMFAIAVWDNVQNRLFLIRDRLGVKPLYFGWDGNSLWFGSELKALRAFRHWRPEIDRTALADYFYYGYINAPRSIYRNVYKLEPGHWLELKKGGDPVIRRYWSVMDAVGNPLAGTEDQLTEQLEALMADAFRLRMVSDVPVGMFLSGGLDSSVVTALLQKHCGNIHTFTIGFGDHRFNEASHAQKVAEHLGTRHTAQVIEPDDAKGILLKWADLYDEPFADSSGIPTYLVSKLAGEQVKVVLSADGGDELFSGYNIYTNMIANMQRREAISPALRRLFSTTMGLLPLDSLDETLASSPFLPDSWRGRRRPTFRLRRMRDWLGSTTNGQMYETALGNSWWADEAAILADGRQQRRFPVDAYAGGFADQMCLWDLHNYLPGDVLTKVDRATMAASIEGREPLIDHRLVEFALRLPLDMRRGALGTKHLLRKVLYKYVPSAIVDRPKMGFGIPIDGWLRNDLSYLVDEYLDPVAINRQNTLNPASVEKAVRAFKARDESATNRVWSLVAFQMWHQKWLTH